MACHQELCPNWSGDGNVCPCALFDIEPPVQTAPEFEQRCEKCGYPTTDTEAIVARIIVVVIVLAFAAVVIAAIRS